jgi:hypothetical protein
MSFSEVSNQRPLYPQNHWELNAPEAKRDLVIKRIAVTLIALINFGLLGLALYYIISYCPFPSQALLISPFIVGVLTALAYLKFPTFGINHLNYTAYLNPSTLIGKGMAYLFFGPFMYAIHHVDWTPYHDPIYANKISKDLEEKSFKNIAEDYGRHFSNLVKYGFIHKKYLSELMALYQEYKPIKREINFWTSEKLEDCEEAKKALKREEVIEKHWKALKNSFEYAFPHPEKPIYNFSSQITQVQLKMRSTCCFGPPTEAIRHFEA